MKSEFPFEQIFIPSASFIGENRFAPFPIRRKYRKTPYPSLFFSGQETTYRIKERSSARKDKNRSSEESDKTACKKKKPPRTEVREGF